MLEPNTPPRAGYTIDSINKEEIGSYVDENFSTSLRVFLSSEMANFVDATNPPDGSSATNLNVNKARL